MDHALEALVRSALAEDIGEDDLTTAATVPPDARCEARLVAKQAGTLSGIVPFRLAFDLLGAEVADWDARFDGERFQKGELLATFTGKTRAVLTAERVAMNFAQHLSGVATLTQQFVAAVEGLSCQICDTRKTTPLLRKLEKAAVSHGGGANHRGSLADGILIKENHITAAGGIPAAVAQVRRRVHHLMRVEVEVTNLAELGEALAAGADAILLDNMSLEMMRDAVRQARAHKVVLEASGNASLDRVRGMAETGVDYISVGALTHSAPAADLSLLIHNA
jgi:nicotinate-nucleotide pyrophosphorylase (carboxylating)